MIIYMAVTKDEYELPCYIADSKRELSRIIGKSESYVSMNMRRGDRKNVEYNFREVEIEDD